MEVPAGLPEARAARAEADALSASFDRDVKRALILWIVRWVIGFLLIWFITGVSGGLGWLWWVGIGFAMLIPVTAMASQWFVSRKLRQAESALAELEEAIGELEQD